MPSAYAPMRQAFIAPAQAYPELWRLLVGMVVLVSAYFLPLAIAFGAFGFLASSGQSNAAFAELNAMDTPKATLAVLFSFVAMVFAVWAAARLMQRRGLATLIGPWGQSLRNFARVSVYLLVFQAVLFVLPIAQPPRIQSMALVQWLMLLPVTLVAVLIQTSAEELVFRGYLQQQLAARFASPLVWLVGPALLFGLVHYDPETMGDNTWKIVAWACVFGLAAGDLTARTGNLGAAIALHFVNNLGAIALVSLDGPLSGLALFKLPFDGADTQTMPALLWLDLVSILIAWLIARLALRR